MLLFRGLLGYGALSCYFWSVQHLPLGDAVLLQYSHPIFVAAIAPFVLYARRPRGGIGRSSSIALAGVGLIVGPAGNPRGPALVGLTGSMLSGLAYMAVRKLSKTEHTLTILVWFPLATIPLSLIWVARAGAAALPKSGVEVAGHLLVFLTALLGQGTLTEGLRRAGAARATAVTMTGPGVRRALRLAAVRDPTPGRRRWPERSWSSPRLSCWRAGRVDAAATSPYIVPTQPP